MVDLLPIPMSVESSTGCLHRSNEGDSVQVTAPERVLRALARLPLAGFPIGVAIAETTAERPRLDDSYAYRLVINETGVRIEADTQWGGAFGPYHAGAINERRVSPLLRHHRRAAVSMARSHGGRGSTFH